MSWHFALAFPCFWAAAALNVIVCLHFFHRFHAHAPLGAPVPTALAAGQKKDAWLVAFKYYLLIALFIAAPIILTVDAIFFKPFLGRRIKKQKQYYSGIN